MKKFRKLFSAVVCIMVTLFTIMPQYLGVDSSIMIGFQSAVVDAAVYGNYNYTVSNNEITITKYTGNESIVSIPSSISGYPVKHIGNNAFDYCSSLTKVTIPSSIKSIGSCAFRSCTNLMSLNIPYSVDTIGNHAFYNCSSLKSVYISSVDITKIMRSTFQRCYSLTDISIPYSIKEIEEFAFADCDSLTTVRIDNTLSELERIGYEAFRGCTNLQYVAIPNSVRTIENNAFANCTNLTTVDIDKISSKLEVIGYEAFRRCTSLEYVAIPISVMYIEDYAFGDCTNLANIDMSVKSRYIVETAFRGTPYYTANYTTDHKSETFYNSGSAKVCTGNQVVVSIFLSDENTPWKPYGQGDSIQASENALHASLNDIKREANIYKKNVNFITSAQDESLKHNIIYKNNEVTNALLYGSHANSGPLRNLVENTGIISDAEKQKIEQKYPGAGIIYVVSIPKGFRSFAIPSKTNNSEYTIVSAGASYDTYRHEILHLYGATDLYYNLGVVGPRTEAYAKKYYSNDAFYTHYGIVGPSSAYLIGWVDCIRSVKDFKYGDYYYSEYDILNN